MSTRSCPTCNRTCYGCDDSQCGDEPCGSCAQAALGKLRIQHAELVIQFEGLNQSHTETTEERDSARADNARLRELVKVAKRHLTTATNAKSENSCRTEAEAARELLFDALAVPDSRERLCEFGMKVARRVWIAHEAQLDDEDEAEMKRIVDGVMK